MVAEKKRHGAVAPNGKVPYPFRLTGPKGRRRPVLDPQLQEIGRKIVELKRAGLTFDQVYFRLLSDGIRAPRTGDELSRTRVQDIFRAA
jgi:hypothetical protein